MAPYWHGHGEQELRLAHGLLLEREHRLDGLERVVVVIQLDRVGAHRLLVVLEVVDARPGVLAADAVRAQHDLVTDVDGAEAGVAGEDVDEVGDRVVAQRLYLGALRPGLRAGSDVRLDLRPGHAHQRPVAHARRDGTVHRLPQSVTSLPAARGGDTAVTEARTAASEATGPPPICQRRILRQSWRTARAR